MPFGPRHETKRVKNLALLLALALMVSAIYAMTLIKYTP